MGFVSVNDFTQEENALSLSAGSISTAYFDNLKNSSGEASLTVSKKDITIKGITLSSTIRNKN